MFRYTRWTALREGAVWVATLVGLLPFYFLVVTALKTDEEVRSTSAVAPPSSIYLGAFGDVLTAGGRDSIPLAMFYSILITGGAVVGLIVLGSLAGYVLSRSTRKWSTLAYYIVLIAIVLPSQLGLVPLYIGARALGLTGNAFGMILLWVGQLLPLAIFLYAAFFRGLSTEYEEAAFMDGASSGQTFFRVVLPLMTPATGTVSILAGMIIWNDFFNSLIFLGGSTVQTLPVAMYSFVGGIVSDWNTIFAVVIISMIPILVYYMVAQKQFIQGFSGGLKG
jgi:raffinose/stachyose/melibiose transport system permease protein